jgi:hypothetical protein
MIFVFTLREELIPANKNKEKQPIELSSKRIMSVC